MTDVEKSIYFYNVDVPDGEQWRRADVLRGLQGLQAEDRVMALGNEQYTWAAVDHVPRGRESGRLRFFRDRRSNLPGFAHEYRLAELPIPDDAGLIEPTHIVLAGDGLIAAEYNHFAPRIPTTFGDFVSRKLDMDLRIGTYVQGSIVEQLERLDYINVMEVSLVSTRGLEDHLRDTGPFGDAVAALSRVEGGRRLNLRLTADRDTTTWTEDARRFVKQVLGMPGAHDGHGAKVLRVTGRDPVTGGDEVVDLLKQKLVRLVDVEKSAQRSKVLNTSSAYQTIEQAIREVRETDLKTAAIVY